MAVSVGQDDDGIVSEINVTPMVDVLLCLLIIFMVSEPAASNEKIPLTIPQEAIVQRVGDPNSTLLVSIDKDGNARIGDKPLATDYPQLVEQLRKNEKAQADSKIAIAGDEKTKYGAIVRVMNAAREAGIAKVGIASKRL